MSQVTGVFQTFFSVDLHKSTVRLAAADIGGLAASYSTQLGYTPDSGAQQPFAHGRILLEPHLTVIRHDASHELIEQRNSERRVAMAWAPHHAFVDQLATSGAQRSHFLVEHFRDVARPVRSGT
jgi:hypothetical protein